jgi:hypothetical protein
MLGEVRSEHFVPTLMLLVYQEFASATKHVCTRVAELIKVRVMCTAVVTAAGY